jgi:hypothetical protein
MAGFATPMSTIAERRPVLLATVLAALCALGVATACESATATHTFPRKLTIKHANGKLKGKLKSPSNDCRAGIVTVHRAKRGIDPIVASDPATGGRWAVRAPRRGRFYATAESFQGPSGRCPDVRSRVVRTG